LSLQGKRKPGNAPQHQISEDSSASSSDVGDSSDSDDVQEDYLANLQGGSDDTSYAQQV